MNQDENKKDNKENIKDEKVANKDLKQTPKASKTPLSHKFTFWLRTSDKFIPLKDRKLVPKENYLTQIERIADFETV